MRQPDYLKRNMNLKLKRRVAQNPCYKHTTKEMKASKLRIGNYIYGPLDELCKVEQLGSTLNNNLVGYREVENIKSYGQNGQKPIPITKDWLLKFDFNCDEECNEYRITTSYCEFTIGKTELEAWFCYEIKMDGFCCFKYVHELQNLYFALTQTELTTI